MRRRAARRAPLTAVPAVLGCLLIALTAAPAHASAYRYWSLWEQQDGGWTYSTTGPSMLRPSDGAVIGFRFAVSEDSRSAVRPRGPADFASVCGGTPPKDGTNRVALVLDFGTAADAPSGERPPKNRTVCARVGTDATAADALATEAKPLRYNSVALLCSIQGYPAVGCGEQTSGDADEETGDDQAAGDGGDTLPTGLGVAAGVGVVAALAGAAVWQSRRRRG